MELRHSSASGGRDRTISRPCHRARHQSDTPDMKRTAETAEPEGVQQGDRLDQKHQRIKRLVEHQIGAGHPPGEQHGAFCGTGRSSGQMTAQPIHHQQRDRHDQQHRHAIGQEPPGRPGPHLGQRASHCGSGQQSRQQGADQSARPHEARQIAEAAHIGLRLAGHSGQRQHRHDFNHIGERKQQGHRLGVLRDSIGRQAGRENAQKQRPFVAQPGAQQDGHHNGIGQPDGADRSAAASDQQTQARKRQIDRPAQRHARKAGPVNRPGRKTDPGSEARSGGFSMTSVVVGGASARRARSGGSFNAKTQTGSPRARTACARRG